MTITRRRTGATAPSGVSAPVSPRAISVYFLHLQTGGLEGGQHVLGPPLGQVEVGLRRAGGIGQADQAQFAHLAVASRLALRSMICLPMSPT